MDVKYLRALALLRTNTDTWTHGPRGDGTLSKSKYARKLVRTHSRSYAGQTRTRKHGVARGHARIGRGHLYKTEAPDSHKSLCKEDWCVSLRSARREESKQVRSETENGVLDFPTLMDLTDLTFIIVVLRKGRHFG